MEPPALKLSLCFVASLAQKSDYQRIYVWRKLISPNGLWVLLECVVLLLWNR